MARSADPHAKIELLRAAEEVFVENGLEKARVEDIAHRAGRSKGSFYSHFESKEEAFEQIVETVVARLSALIDRVPEGDRRSFDELREQWLACDLEIFEFLWQNRGVMRVLLEGRGGSAYAFLINEFAVRANDRVHTALLLGQKQGLYRSDFDVSIVSLAIAGAYDRFARNLVCAKERPELKAMLHAMQDWVLFGIAATEHHPRAIADPRVKSHVDGGKKKSSRSSSS